MSYASSARAWLRQRGEINDLTATIYAQKHDIAALQQEKRRWQDPAYVRTQARLRFGWVMPRETGYRVIGDNGKILGNSASTLSQPVQSSGGTGAQWWDSAWQSVVTAGGEPTTTSRGPAPGTNGQTPAGHIDKNGKASSGAHHKQHQNKQRQKKQGGG